MHTRMCTPYLSLSYHFPHRLFKQHKTKQVRLAEGGELKRMLKAANGLSEL